MRSITFRHLRTTPLKQIDLIRRGAVIVFLITQFALYGSAIAITDYLFNGISFMGTWLIPMMSIVLLALSSTTCLLRGDLVDFTCPDLTFDEREIRRQAWRHQRMRYEQAGVLNFFCYELRALVWQMISLCFVIITLLPGLMLVWSLYLLTVGIFIKQTLALQRQLIAWVEKQATVITLAP